ncbi:Fe-binding Fe/S cluster assembly protein ISA1 Ecym_7292 [Eremothecium cymbalariae DBVPG|uniref:Iron-sulfur assembly protein 1 n=1 Tax=Eremothecium cymbalariae (strain CBS 270.75 / DBVPG 7215 / KCTC 17166 / NRRL Y-17582) TaxID=931890 RepID=G8JWB5_ERECY|nr:hypothetical protein Ecym_7292 [Eremothecium cymbalariae DBVPG\
MGQLILLARIRAVSETFHKSYFQTVRLQYGYGVLNNSRRFLQTQLKGSGNTSFDKVSLPSAWSFKFVKESGTEKEAAAKNQKKPQITETSKVADKWSKYSLPLKRGGDGHEVDVKQKEVVEKGGEVFASSGNAAANKKKAKRRLRPRKALLTLSPSAIIHLKRLLDKPEPQLVRVGVRNRGCSGLVYDLQYITKPGKFDEIVEQDGVKIVIDSKALFSIVGSEMDWVDDNLQSRFIFKNPNSKGTCGCGESFMV